MIHERKDCRACGSTRLETILELGTRHGTTYQPAQAS